MQQGMFEMTIRAGLKAAASMAAAAMLLPGAALAATDTALLPRNLSP